MNKFIQILFFIIIYICSSTYAQQNNNQNNINNSTNDIKLNNQKLSKKTILLNYENVLGIAINNNFELKAIGEQKNVTNLTIIEKFRDFFPSLTVTYAQTEESKKRDADTRQHSLKFDSTVSVYNGGNTKLAYDISKLQSILARNDYKIALNKLIAQTTNIYLQTLQQKESIEINKKTLERGLLQLKFITREFELGEATKLSKMEIETKVKEIEYSLKQSVDSYNTALTNLKLLLKLDWRQPANISGDITNNFILHPIASYFTVDKLVSIALKNRKEIESVDVEFIINKKKYQMSKHYYYPNVSVGLNYSLTDEEYFPREKGWGVNLQISSAFLGNSGSITQGYNEQNNKNSKIYSSTETLNILDSLSYKRNIVESKINFHKSREEKLNMRQKIALEISSGFEGLINAWNLIQISKEQLQLYDNQLLIERLKANMGDTRRFDLLEKEIERGQTAIAYLDSIVKYLQAASALELSLGADIGFLKLSNIKKEEIKDETKNLQIDKKN